MSTLTTAMVEEEVKCAHRQIERDGGSFLHRVIVHLADEVEHMKRERDTAMDERTDWMRGAEDLLHEKYRPQAELDAAHDCEDALRSELTKLRAELADAKQCLSMFTNATLPDTVVVSREEWEIIEQIIKASAICANDGGTDYKCCTQTDDHHIPLESLRALRAKTKTNEAR